MANNVGRPSIYEPALVDIAYRLCILGLTDVAIAEHLYINVDTLKDWRSRYPEFSASFIRGREEADVEVAQSLRARALGYSHKAMKIFPPRSEGGEPIKVEYTEHYPPDTAAASLWLRNRQPKTWRDKTEVGVSGGLGLELFVGDALAGRKAIVDATARVIEDESDASDDAKT